ncbi:MAG TPA: M12 family metallo-peptidase [Bacteroidia bacterium]|nr:M12 family metallo-peptidase [Bacteroidia bacterium]
MNILYSQRQANIHLGFVLLISLFFYFHTPTSSSAAAPASKTLSIFHSVVEEKLQLKLNEIGKDILLFRIDGSKCAEISADKPEKLLLSIPGPDGTTFTVDLEKNELFQSNMETGVFGKNGPQKTRYVPGEFYKGKVTGDQKSVVSFSIFQNSLMGFISRSKTGGNIVIARLNEILSGAPDYYVIYDDSKLYGKEKVACHTGEVLNPQRNLREFFSERFQQAGSTNCVHVYFECDYQMFLDNGQDVNQVYNFVTGVFNQVQQIFANESVSVVISSVYVWTVNDPYDGLTTASDYLTTFQSVRPTFNGDIAHLLSTHNNNAGGIAFLDVLCNPAYAYAFSQIDNSFQSFPLYAQSVKAISHETGHNLGSNHTTWCGWTGGALDNCAAPEGGCVPGPVPTNGGTIMSYCEQTVYGVNFANGFGQQPGDVIRSRVNGSSCLTSCNCTPDVTIFISPSPTICAGTTVTFTANPVNGGAAPVYNWKVNGTVVFGNSITYTTASLTNGDEVTCVMTSNDLCAGGDSVSSNAIIMSVTSTVAPSITIQTANLDICQGETTQFSATFVNEGTSPHFQWLVNGQPAGTDSIEFTTAGLNNNDEISCVLLSSLSCATTPSDTSNVLHMTISTVLVPAITIATPSTVICQGTMVTFSATPVNGGSAPNYQWQVNGNDSGLNSPFFTLSSLNNGDVVSCTLTSNNVCASPGSAVSNDIIMNVNTTGVLPMNDLLVWYPFNGNTRDNSGNNFNGTASGARLTKDRFGDSNNAYTFNGARDHVQIGSSPLLNNFSTGLTVCAWVYLGANNSSQASIVSKWKFNVTDDQYLLWLYNKKPNFAISNPLNPASGVQSTHVLSDSTWYFVVGTWDTSGTHCIYIDGALDATRLFPNFTTINNTSITDLRIGTEDSTYRAFKGKIDDVRIYNRVLTLQEIQILWNEGSTAAVHVTATAATICEGHSITFEAVPLAGGQNPFYQWKINGNNAGPNNPLFITNTLSNGDIVTCEMTSSDPCSQPLAVSNPIQITVIPEIQQSVTISTNDNPTCPGYPAAFRALPNNGSLGSSYRWKINGIDAGNSSDQFYSAVNDSDIVSCEMISLFPCATPALAISNSILMRIDPNTTPSVVISTTSSVLCEGDTAVFSAVPTIGGSSPVYAWLINGNISGIDSALFVTVSLTDGDIVACEMISNSPCAAVDTVFSNEINVTVHPLNTPSVSVTASALTICSNDTLNLSPASVHGGTSPTYVWYLNEILAGTSSGDLQLSNLHNQDRVYCVLTSDEVCLTDATVYSDTLTLVVNSAPVPVITEQAGILSSTPAITYQWYYNAYPITGATNQNLTALANGYYQVEITDENGCSALSDVYADTTVGLSEIQPDDPRIQIFPNPTGGDAVLRTPGHARLTAELLSIESKLLALLFDGTATEANRYIMIPSGSLASGIYLIRLLREDRVYFRRLIVNR